MPYKLTGSVEIEITGMVKSSRKKKVSTAISLGNLLKVLEKHFTLRTVFAAKFSGAVYNVDVAVGLDPSVV